MSSRHEGARIDRPTTILNVGSVDLFLPDVTIEEDETAGMSRWRRCRTGDPAICAAAPTYRDAVLKFLWLAIEHEIGQPGATESPRTGVPFCRVRLRNGMNG